MALHPQFPAYPYHAWRASGYDGASSTTKALLKMARLKQWCEEATAAELEDGGNGTPYNFLYVDQDSFEKHAPKSLAYLAASFTEYKH